MIEIGDSRDVLVRINCNRETLEFLLDCLPPSDGWTTEVRDAYLAATSDDAESTDGR